MANKVWENKDYSKFFNLIKNNDDWCDDVAKDIALQKNSEFMMDHLKELFEKNYGAFLEEYNYFNDTFESTLKSELGKWIIDKSDFNNIEEIVQEAKYYVFFKEIIINVGIYGSSFSIDEAIEKEDDKDNYRDLIRYVIARYYLNNHLSKEDYLNKQEHGIVIYQLIDEYFKNKNELLKQVLRQYKQQEDNNKQQQIDKKIEKIIQKTYKKLKQNHLSYEELEQLKNATNNKLLKYINSNNETYLELNKLFNERINSLKLQPVKEVKEDKLISNIDNNHLGMIEEFYQHNHLYFKKTQIKTEIILYPKIVDFYQSYLQTNIEDKEECVHCLEELASDIKESGLKKTECIRRLYSVIQKEIEDFINSEEETLIEEEVEVKATSEYKKILQIGKFEVYKDSYQANPVNINKIMQLIALDDQDLQDNIRSLIYQIGYDKVQTYLLKNPLMYVYQLQSYIKLDRSLRFEYQRILEDIEMYFKSSLTYFLTNKYDEKYLTVENNQWFYKRGYLMRNIFKDTEEHFDLVKQLRNRINDEINNNNNIQIRDEYHRYSYALPFSTAAGIMTFGWIINMFENLNTYDQKVYLNTYFYHISPQTFCNWLISLARLRNRCAHYQSLYRLSSLKELRQIITKDIDANNYDDEFKKSSLFYYTLIMTRLSPEVDNIEDFIDDIGILFRKVQRENEYFDLFKDYSFPKNWRSVLEAEKSSRINFI